MFQNRHSSVLVAQTTTFPVTPTKAGTSTQHGPPVSAGPSAQTAQAPPATQTAQTARRTSYRRSSSISRRNRQRPTRSSRPVRPAPQEHTANQLVHPRRRPITKHEPFDYGASSTFSKDLLDHYFTPPPAALSESEEVKYSTVSIDLEGSETTKSKTTDGTNLGKRKRGSPEVIPHPPGCSYGFNADYFIIDSDDEEEAERDTARRVAAATDAAKRAKGFAEENVALNDDAEDELPAAKRACVSEPYRRRSTTRQAARTASTTTSTKTSTEAPSSIPTSLVSPSQRPGFISNSRQTYQAPDLSTIDSSGLIGDAPEVAKLETSTPQAAFTPQAFDFQPSQPQVPENQEPQDAQTQSGSSQKSGMFNEDRPFISTSPLPIHETPRKFESPRTFEHIRHSESPPTPRNPFMLYHMRKLDNKRKYENKRKRQQPRRSRPKKKRSLRCSTCSEVAEFGNDNGKRKSGQGPEDSALERPAKRRMLSFN